MVIKMSYLPDYEFLIIKMTEINIDMAGKRILLMKIGELNISYKELVKTFGEPNGKPDLYKTDAEWVGYVYEEPFKIYNYKDGKSYLGDEGLDVKDITEWHVSGRYIPGNNVVSLLEKVISEEVK